MMVLLPLNILDDDGEISIRCLNVKSHRPIVKRGEILDDSGLTSVLNLQDFLDYASDLEEFKLDALIAHPSRCGSTLLARYFEALDKSAVLIEPELFRSALLATKAGPTREKLMNSLCASLAFSLHRHYTYAVIKLTSSVHSHSTILESAPISRRIYIYRNPLEIFVSQRDRPAQYFQLLDQDKRMAQLVFDGRSPKTLPRKSIVLADFIARNYASTDAMISNTSTEQPILLNYETLLDTEPAKIFSILELNPDSVNLATLTERRRYHSHENRQHIEYRDDRIFKQENLDDFENSLITERCLKLYQSLEAVRDQRHSSKMHSLVKPQHFR